MVGQAVALLIAWGRRAEDPFRGLRAGPVRSSPHFCSYLPRRRQTPEHANEIISPPGVVCLSDLANFQYYPPHRKTKKEAQSLLKLHALLNALPPYPRCSSALDITSDIG